MTRSTTTRTCGECHHHETSLTVLTEGEHSFPGVEFRCRHAQSHFMGSVVRGPEAERCALFAPAVRTSEPPPF